MKRFGLYAVLGLGTMLAVVSFYSLRAQGHNPGNQPTASPPRVGFLNYEEVLKQYKKINNIKEEAKKREEPLLTKFKAKTKEIETLRAQIAALPAAEQTKRDELNRQVQHLLFEAKNMQEDARKELGKFLTEEMAKVYFEIYHVTRQVAQMQGLECVIRYQEDWNREEYNKPERVVGRLQQPIWPLYYDKHAADITITVYTQLNNNLK